MKKNIVLFLVLTLLMSSFCVQSSAQDLVNVALFKEATASSFLSEKNGAGMANDGINDNESYTNWKSAADDELPWWQTDLGISYNVSKIEIESAVSASDEEKQNFRVVGANEKDFSDSFILVPEVTEPYAAVYEKEVEENLKARYIRVEKTQKGKFSIGEVRVLALRNETKSEKNEPLTFSSYYGTFSDIEGTRIEKDVYLLSSLGIMNGYSDGSFLPEKRITRAEFTAVAVRLLGYTYEDSSVTFGDVPKNHWAHSYIETAAKANLVNGVGNEMFSPDEFVTKSQVVKILVSLLGYGGAAELSGGFPMGYESIAADIGLYDGITFSSGEEIKRGEIAELCCNVLHLSKVSVSSVGKDVVGTIYKDNFLMTGNLHIKKETGIVNKAEGVSLTGSSPENNDGYIQIDAKIFETEIPNVKKYLGLKVDYYYNENTEKVVAVVVHRHNEILEIDAGDLTDIDENVLTYKDEEEKERKADISITADVLYNEVALRDYEEDELLPKSGSVKLIDNNGDGEFDVYFINETEQYIVNWVNINQKTIYLKNSKEVFDTDSAYVNIVRKSKTTFYEEQNISLSEIKEGNIITVTKSKNTTGKKRIKIVVCDDIVEGRLTEENSRYIAINGEKYEFSNLYNSYKASVGASGIFCLDSDGKVAAFDVEKNVVSRYGYLININKQSGVDETVEMKMFTSAGNIEILKAAENDKFTVDTKTFENYEMLEKYLKQSGKNGGFYQAVKYTQNSKGEVKDIDTVQAGGDLTRDYDSQTRYYKSTSVIGMQFAIDNDTVMFKLPDDAGNEDEYEIITSASLGHNQQYTMEAYDCGEEKVAGLLLFTGSLSGSGGSASMLFVVDEILYGLNEEGEKCVELIGLYGGAEVRLTEKTSGIIKASDLSRGDVLTLELASNGEIKGYSKQFYYGDKPDDAPETAISENSPQYGDPYSFTYYAYGKVKSKKDGIISIEFANAETMTYKNMTVYADSSDLNVYYIDKKADKVGLANSSYIKDAKTVGDAQASYALIRVGSGDVKELIIFG